MSQARALESLTVVVPFHDNPGQLAQCIAGLKASTVPFELVMVDDASKGREAPELARAAADRVVTLERNSGPAVARNEGVKVASGSLIAFIDSDVVVRPDTLALMLAALREDPGAAALFGSYDDEPADRSTVSFYRNLLHHHVHHRGPREASTFWAGCGAVRKADFEAVGGFDASFRHPSIEDIELGMRLKGSGRRILLLPHIQAKHLKRWRLGQMIEIDVTRRAMPWTKLLIERPGTGGDLNLEVGQKLCVVCVFLMPIASVASAFVPALRELWAPLWLPLVLLVPILAINRDLYALFLRKRGVFFALAALLLHLLYFAYGGLAFAWVKLTFRPQRRST